MTYWMLVSAQFLISGFVTNEIIKTDSNLDADFLFNSNKILDTIKLCLFRLVTVKSGLVRFTVFHIRCRMDLGTIK